MGLSGSNGNVGGYQSYLHCCLPISIRVVGGLATALLLTHAFGKKYMFDTVYSLTLDQFSLRPILRFNLPREWGKLKILRGSGFSIM